MERPLQIVFRQMETSPALEARIREKVAMLERLAPRLTGCRVVVEKVQRRHRRGDHYRVAIDLAMPSQELAVTHTGPEDQAHEDVYVALRDAFDAAARRLQDRVREMRGKTKHHGAPLTGRVLRLFPEEGYGFVATEAGEVYVHRNSVLDDGFDRLRVGSEVSLEVAEDESAHGWQATTVRRLGD